MKVIGIGLGLVFASMLGCNGNHADDVEIPASSSSTRTPATPPAKQFRVISVNRIYTRDGDSGLVLDFETDTCIEDKESLRKEVNTIWKSFRKDVEKAQLKSGVIRAFQYEGTGALREGKGYGFVFVRGDDGRWRLLDDDQEAKQEGGKIKKGQE